MSKAKLTQFTLDDNILPVRFVETTQVKNGVTCDVYSFVDDNSRDLAIVTVASGRKTPLQRILLGEKTIEGYCEGMGTLTVVDEKGKERQYTYKTGDNGSVDVGVGQTMQWYANTESDLVFYEVCQPPFKDGRFENISDLD